MEIYHLSVIFEKNSLKRACRFGARTCYHLKSIFFLIKNFSLPNSENSPK